MDAKNIGVTELGKLLDESKQNVLRWRDEERRLKPEMAVQIAQILEVSVNSLLLLPSEPDASTKKTAARSSENHAAVDRDKGKISDRKAAASLLELLEIIPSGDGERAYDVLLSVFGEDDEKSSRTTGRDQSSPATRPRAKSP